MGLFLRVGGLGATVFEQVLGCGQGYDETVESGRVCGVSKVGSIQHRGQIEYDEQTQHHGQIEYDERIRHDEQRGLGRDNGRRGGSISNALQWVPAVGGTKVS